METLPENADILYRLAWDKKNEGNFLQALSLFKTAAELGNTKALNAIGNMYQYGQGIPKNIEKAFDIYLEGYQNTQDNSFYRDLMSLFHERNDNAVGMLLVKYLKLLQQKTILEEQNLNLKLKNTNLQHQISDLESEVNDLQAQIYYEPGGEAFHEAKSRFEKGEYSDIIP